MQRLKSDKQHLHLLDKLRRHDLSSFQHSLRVANLLYEFGTFIKLPEAKLSELYKLGTLHDIGKLYVDKNILNKEGKLTDAEYSQIVNHTVNGFKLLKREGHSWPLLNGVLSHHENYNGTGYPSQIKEQNIPWNAQLLRIVDSFDAMTNERSYKKAFPPGWALNQLENLKGIWYEPHLAETFITMQDKAIFINPTDSDKVDYLKREW